MNAIIPNKLKFDLDLQDLPARATQVSSEALSISAGSGCVNYRVFYPEEGRPATVFDYSESQVEGTCRRTCREDSPSVDSRNLYWYCSCC